MTTRPYTKRNNSLSIEQQINEIVVKHYPAKIACTFCVTCKNFIAEIKANPLNAMQIIKKYHKPEAGDILPRQAIYNFPEQTGCKYCFLHKTESMRNKNNKTCRCGKHAPYFNFPNMIGGVCCSDCREPGMENVVAKSCYCGKTKGPSFGMPGDRAPSRCANCKTVGMADIKHEKCEWINENNQRCPKSATFNDLGKKTPRFCHKHASDEMKNVRHKSDCPGANGEGCTGRSTYNLPTEKRPIYCRVHKSEEMINVRDQKCLGKDNIVCPNHPKYGFPGQKKLYCNAHKTDDMVNVCVKKCLGKMKDGTPCQSIGPSFNYVGSQPAYCLRHKLPDMINVKHNRCQDCTAFASFNYKGNKTPIKCFTHRLTDMICTKRKYCEQCDELAGYNYAGMKPILCRTHRMVGMIRVGQKVCENPECDRDPKYNLPGETVRRFCSAHKETHMIDLGKKITECIIENCPNMPRFNYRNKKPIYCDHHKLPEMIDLEQSKKCCVIDCIDRPISSINENYYCTTHYPDRVALSVFNRECSICGLAPNNFLCSECKKRNHKHIHSKEWDVANHLLQHINQNPVLDRMLPAKECSKRRPDVYYSCNQHVVIVEIDEDQHRRYDPTCECARISEIVGAIGGRAVTIIRYNPDKIKSEGRVFNVPRNDRLERLVGVVKTELNVVPTEFKVKLIQLYYDGDDEIYESYKEDNITTLVAI